MVATKDRRVSDNKSRNGDRKAARDTPARKEPIECEIEVEWSEIRRVGDGGAEELFLVKGERTREGWSFYERSTWEVQWFQVAPALNQRCIAKAQQILREAAVSVSPIRRPAIEVAVGNVNDNTTVLYAAKGKLKAGAPDEATYMLNALRHHIITSPDPKSRWMLPEIQELLELATIATMKNARVGRSDEVLAGCRDNKHRVLDADHGAESRRDSIYTFKARLIDTTVITTTLTWTYGFLVHDIRVMALPGLTEWPAAANVVAGLMLAIGLRFVLKRGG